MSTEGRSTPDYPVGASFTPLRSGSGGRSILAGWDRTVPLNSTTRSGFVRALARVEYSVFDPMTGHSSDYDTDDVHRRLTAASQYSTRAIDIESIVVRYENRADRCTITPRECPAPERLTTWLSADVDAFVDLEAVR